MPALAASAATGLPTHTTAIVQTTVVRADVKTGRLIRSTTLLATAAAPRAGGTNETSAPQPVDLFATIERIAEEQGVEAPLVRSVIKTESNFNPLAVSPKGALGVMQLIPSTARRFGVSDPFNAADNIQGGVRYLRFLLDYYKGDYVRAIAAYNAGEGAVDKYKGVPPYWETVSYLSSVAKNLKSERARAPLAHPAALHTEPTRTVIASTGSDGKLYYKTP